MEIISREQILNEYDQLNNIENLFNSDILIFPIYNNGLFSKDQAEIIKFKLPINIKYYSEDQYNIRTAIDAIIPDIYMLGSIVISSIAGLITIWEWIKKLDSKKQIITVLYIKVNNDTFCKIVYNGIPDNLELEINRFRLILQ